MRYLLGVDLGTSGTKTVLFDETGKVIASKTVEYPYYNQRTVGQSRIQSSGTMQPLSL